MVKMKKDKDMVYATYSKAETQVAYLTEIIHVPETGSARIASDSRVGGRQFPGPFITRSLLVVLTSSHPTAFPTPGHRLALLWRIFVPSRTESGALGEAWLDECLSKSRNGGAAVMNVEPSKYGARPDNYVVYSMRKVPRSSRSASESRAVTSRLKAITSSSIKEGDQRLSGAEPNPPSTGTFRTSLIPINELQMSLLILIGISQRPQFLDANEERLLKHPATFRTRRRSSIDYGSSAPLSHTVEHVSHSIILAASLTVRAEIIEARRIVCLPKAHLFSYAPLPKTLGAFTPMVAVVVVRFCVSREDKCAKHARTKEEHHSLLVPAHPLELPSVLQIPRIQIVAGSLEFFIYEREDNCRRTCL
ncbi:hypothetical protein EDD85DRAFT_796133 [Armillaria nabsnona]|nr:hypothetical protein EDD85DRAFT_796133 [Armillaria nabsnona]